MANEFLFKEYELCFGQLKYYDDRHTNVLTFLFTITSTVATAIFAIYKFTEGPTQGFFSFQAIVSGLVFVGTLLLYLAMLQNRLYFTYTARQINAIRKYLLETEAAQFHDNQLYTSTDFPALKLASVHTFQLLGAAIISSLFAGILAYSIGSIMGRDSLIITAGLTFLFVVLCEIYGGIKFLASAKRKSADQVIHGQITRSEKSTQKR